MSKKSNFTLGTLIAAGVGYLAGILTAPKSGKQTRKDMAKNASKAKIESEKQLKKLYSELGDLVAQADKKAKDTKTKADAELNKAISNAKRTQSKAKQLLSALHDGDAEDPELKAILADVKKAKSDLSKYLKK